MREIKFRAWNKALNTMADSENIGGALGSLLVATNYQGIEDFIFMQYTGLKDKNGKEICEGDILTDHGEEGPLYVEYLNDHASFVFVDKFDPFGISTYTTIQISYEQFEVIGNIYEDSHLLEGATNGSS
ncbi:YopX family protein [Oceanobacillus timonensis]|uniref:YopX family protein n=1 Tax=Oceanobacillus timonensis TaxID=1926285 RepID=UPI0009BBD352|nr:YopX family protein [Oceanobacillus timonensis]